MKAAVFQGTKKPLVVQDVPDPECAPNGALIRVEANGVCRSDWHAWSGDWHWMGLVAQPGQVQIGKRHRHHPSEAAGIGESRS